MSLRESQLAALFYRVIETALLPKVERIFADPLHFTMMGVAIGAMVPLGFLIHPLAGCFLMVLSGIADATDGLIARSNQKATVYGAFLDSTMDRLSDFCYIIGFWMLFWGSGKEMLSGVLVFLCTLFTLMISYVKARAEALGGECNVGLMERGLRTVYLIVWALLLGLLPDAFDIALWTGLIVFCALTLVTLLQRIAYVQVRLRRKKP